jgi:tRNA-dihydrouridine synthase
MLIRQAELGVKYKGEYTAIREMRKHTAWYTQGLPGSSKLRAAVNQVSTLENLGKLLERLEG